VLGQTFTVQALAAVAGVESDELDRRLRDLVRREILELDTDPRSPERGQYGFVQALIREVAYARLARRDRRDRHLSAARYFESLGDDELAGALATHYVAAYRAVPDGPEGQAVAAQARVSLRAAAERAHALGAPVQALAHFEEFLELAPDEREAAMIRERAGSIADDAGRHQVAAGHFGVARDAWEALGDRAAAAGATAGLGRALIGTGRWDEALDLLVTAREAYQDVAATAGGARLGSALAALHSKRNEDEAAIAEADRALISAERLGLVPEIISLLVTKGTSMGTVGRFHEAMALLDGATRLAERHALVPQSLRAASMRALVVMDDDPRAGFDGALEPLAVARRYGLATLAVNLASNAAEVGLRLGEWPWCVAALDEVLASDLEPFDRLLATSQRTTFAVVLGEATVDARARLRDQATGGPGTEFFTWDPEQWHTIATGESEEARDRGIAAARADPLNAPAMYERAAIGAARLGDVATLDVILAEFDALGRQGRALAATRAFLAALRAGAAPATSRAARIAAFRSAAAAQRDLACEFNVALVQLEAARALDVATPEGREAAVEARRIFERLGAVPFLGLLAALEGAVPA
jgi:tetratricopeptide (TPR) repeat protein